MSNSTLSSVSSDPRRSAATTHGRPLLEIDTWLRPYRQLWAGSLDALERHLDTMPDNGTTPDHPGGDS